MEGSSPDDCPFWVRVIVNQYIASILCIEGEQWRIKVFLQSGIYFITGGKSSVSVQINDHLPSQKNSIRDRSDQNLNLSLMDFDNTDRTRLLRERHVEGAGKSDLQFLREKYESEDLENACKEEYAKCVKVLDRLSLVLCIFCLYVTLHYLLAQPAQLWVPWKSTANPAHQCPIMKGKHFPWHQVSSQSLMKHKLVLKICTLDRLL